MRIEDMAEQYLEEIRTLQSAGPYYLGGLCFGAKVAMEMARRLVETGEKVHLLAVLDAFAPGHPRLLPWSRRVFVRINFHFQSLRQLSARDQLKYVREKLGIIKSRIWETLTKSAQSGRSLMTGWPWDSSLLANQAPEGTSYVPKVYPGKITVFSPSEQLPLYHHEPDMGWSELAGGGLEIHVVPGRFASIIAEPAVSVMAEKLRSCLAKARNEANSLQPQERPPHGLRERKCEMTC
jgi:thioesterase domain-containing protein